MLGPKDLADFCWFIFFQVWWQVMLFWWIFCWSIFWLDFFFFFVTFDSFLSESIGALEFKSHRSDLDVFCILSWGILHLRSFKRITMDRHRLAIIVHPLSSSPSFVPYHGHLVLVPGEFWTLSLVRQAGPHQECVELTAARLKEAGLTEVARSLRFDMLAHPELLRILASCSPPFTVVFADIGGNRELTHVVELLQLPGCLWWFFLDTWKTQTICASLVFYNYYSIIQDLLQVC